MTGDTIDDRYDRLPRDPPRVLIWVLLAAVGLLIVTLGLLAVNYVAKNDALRAETEQKTQALERISGLESERQTLIDQLAATSDPVEADRLVTELEQLRTESQTVASIGLTGPTGPPGPAGVAGSPGSAGRDGRDGADGSPGPEGRDGVDGVDGSDGSDGADGAPGPSGPAGADGEDVDSFHFTFLAVTYTCTDPESDGDYVCEPQEEAA